MSLVTSRAFTTALNLRASAITLSHQAFIAQVKEPTVSTRIPIQAAQGKEQRVPLNLLNYFYFPNPPLTQKNPAYSYCGDHLDRDGVIYIQGSNGDLTNMDIDCDGIQGGPGNDRRCGYSADTQSQTSFQDAVAGYKKGVSDLNPYVHPYVVFGNVGTKSGFANFDPQSHGVEPLSLMAVVCGDKLVSSDPAML